MPQVPYNPVPSQTLQDIPTPELRPSIPHAAFGGDVAAATQGLGKAIAGVGDEVFAVALKMQDTANRAEVDKADTEFMKAAGLLHADFQSKKGLNAKDALPQYQKDLEDARENIRKSIKSDAAKKMYDSGTLSTLGRTLFQGAGHAGNEVATARRATVDERISTTVATGGNSADPRQVEAARQKAIELTRERNRDLGRPGSDDPTETIINSSINANHISFLAKNGNLEEAEKKFAALDKDKMTKVDLDRVAQVLQTQRHSQGSAAIVDNLLKAHTDTDGNLNISVAELHKKAQDMARKNAPNDETYPTVVTRTLDGQLNQQRYARKSEIQDSTQIIQQRLQSGVKNMDELLADPKVRAAYEKLPPSEQNKMPLRIHGYIIARDRENNEQMMTQLNGMKNNDVENFLNFNPNDPEHKLSQANIRQVQNWQEQRKKATAQDPRVDRAMGWLRQSRGAQMEELGVYRRTERSKDDYDLLTGQVQNAYDLWIENKGKPPTQKEFNEQIAPELFKGRIEPGFFGMTFGGNKMPAFKPNTSSKEYKSFSETWKADYETKMGVEPSDAEINKAFNKTQLLKLYPPKKSTP